MQWEAYYEKIGEWSASTAVNRMSQLTSFGPPDEMTDAINIIGIDDRKGAARLLKKAIAAGVKFSGEQLTDISLVCDKEVLNQAIQFSSDSFTADDLEALYCSCDDSTLIEIAKKQKIRLPEDLAEDAETEEILPDWGKKTVSHGKKHCPNCSIGADSNFCPNCGTDLRRRTASKSAAQVGPADYSGYLRFYPDELEAIKALRIDTGLSPMEAKKIIDALFDGDTMPEESKFSHSSEWQPVSSARQEKAQSAVKTVGKAVGMGAFATGLLGFKIVTKLTGRYMKKRR